MTPFIQTLQAEGVRLALGAMIVLVPGSLIALSLKHPDRIRRLGTLSLIGASVWIIAVFAGWSSPFASLAKNAVPQAMSPQLAPKLRVHSVSSPGKTPYVFPATLQRSSYEEPPAALRHTGSSPSEEPTDRSEALPPLTAENETPWTEILAWAYLSGVALGISYLVLGAFRLRQLLGRTKPLPDSHAHLQSDSADIRLLEKTDRAFCCGLFTPKIILPASALDNERIARCLIAHEMGHVRHRDLHERWLFALAIIVFYPIPLFWWLRNRVHLAGELMADDHAVAHENEHDYVLTMIAVVEKKMKRQPLSWLVTPLSAPLFSRPSLFYRRMTMLMNRKEPLSTETKSRRLLWSCAPAIGCALVLAFGTSADTNAAQDKINKTLIAEDGTSINATIDLSKGTITYDPPGLGSLKPNPKKTPVLVLNTDRQEFPLPGGANDSSAKSVVEGGLFVFDSVVIPEGVTLVLTGSNPAKFLVSGEVKVTGTIQFNNKGGYQIQRHESAAHELKAESRPTSRPTSRSTSPAAAGMDAPTSQPILGSSLMPMIPDEPQQRQNDASHSLYLLEITNRALDLQGEISIFKVELQMLKPMVDSGVRNSIDLQTTRLKLETAIRKHRVITIALDAEIDRLKVELESLTDELKSFRNKKKKPRAVALRQQLSRVRGQIDMLSAVR